ncbi:phosphate signaling complex protein PhoU [Pontiellaceae bacterium B12219]|nr:phosphate signaling complex protein PhoU [Pontiellaceae bacterium B12219]
MTSQHTDREFESELQAIRKSVCDMAESISSMGAQAMQGLFESDLGMAYAVIHADDQVDRLEMEVDRRCISAIALRQPVGTDLRFIVSSQKIVSDLERIADHLVTIAEKTIELLQDDEAPVDPEMEAMFNKALTLVGRAVEAFLAADSEGAAALMLEDRGVDAYQALLFRSMLERLRSEEMSYAQISRLMAMVNCVERIGDHAKNICEKAVYYATGQPVAHRKVRDGEHPACIVFLCVQNSARSQMAEALAKRILPGSIQVFSAGSSPADAINPIAVQVMQEIGIDLSCQYTKRLTDIPIGKADLVITLCREEVCINLPGEVRRDAWHFNDPASLSVDADKLTAFRNVRDELKKRIEHLNTSIKL